MKKQVFNGIDRPDVWEKALAGKKVGLITNPSGVDRNLRLTSDILYESGVLSCLFAPEHGVRGDKQAGERIDTYIDEKTGLPVYSLYGANNKNISPEILDTLDAVAFDVQDVGARFYTYIYTLSYAMEDCASSGKEMIVFDRLNPLGGARVEGSVLEREFSSFVGRYPIATRFNMTAGEFARFINEEEKIGCSLTVIPVEGWTRDTTFQETDLSWIPPSPNLPTPDSVLCYIGTCLSEGTNLSEGRGTTRPFETVGAPWLDADKVADYMNSLGLCGVIFRPCHFTPTFSKHAGMLCHGVQIHVTDRKGFSPFESGLYLFDYIRKNYSEFEIFPAQSGQKRFFDKLLGSGDFEKDDFDVKEFIRRQNARLCEYEALIKRYYLYT